MNLNLPLVLILEFLQNLTALAETFHQGHSAGDLEHFAGRRRCLRAREHPEAEGRPAQADLAALVRHLLEPPLLGHQCNHCMGRGSPA